MIKWTKFDLQNSNGTYIQFYNDALIKTAEYSAELKHRLTGLEKNANKTYVLVNAMGSGEWWGSNRNGDYFPDTALVRDHKTFEKLGHAYKHHVNKDPNTALGVVKIAVFNPDMHRVELVIELDNQRAKDILDRIEKGEYPAVSMGVKVPYDICSICGKKSKRTSDYCEHLKNEMNLTHSDGRKVYAINDTDLKFFDISFVRIPADRTAGVLAKVAGTETAATPSAVEAEELMKSSGIKESAINKIIDGTVSAVDNDPKRLIYASQQDMPREELAEVLSKYTLKEILSTLLGLRIVPKPMEFQRIVLIKAGQSQLADEAEKRGSLLIDVDEDPEYPEDLSLENFNDELAQKIAHWVPGMTLTAPHVVRRVIEKRAALAQEGQHPVAITINPGIHAPALNAPTESTFSTTKNPLIGILGLGALYIGYNNLVDSLGFGKSIAQQGKFEQFLLSKPWLIPIVLGAAAAGTVGVQDMMFNKTAGMFRPDFLKRTLVAVPASYIYAGSQENKLQQGQPITEFGDLVRRHPFLTSVAGIVGIGQLQKLFKRGPIGPGSMVKKAEYAPDVIDRVVSGLTPEKFELFYNDVIDA